MTKRMEKYMIDIPNYDTFAKIEPITKGLSSDKKYYIETTDGQRMFLRISDLVEYDRKKAEYDMMKRVYNIGVLTSQPIDFGLCDDGKSCYSLSGWLDGEDAEKALPFMSETEQYVLGLKSGKTLRKIHTLPAPKDIEPWGVRFERKVYTWIEEYKSKQQIHSETGEMLIYYLEKHRNVLDICTQTFIHGDYNSENIIVMPNGKISVIDFNSYNTSYGDPWWDLENIAWMPTMFPHFQTGQIYGYFNGNPPMEFWYVLTYYLAYNALAALTDAQSLNGIEDGTEIVNNILKWTDNFQNLIPTWYLKKFLYSMD